MFFLIIFQNLSTEATSCDKIISCLLFFIKTILVLVYINFLKNANDRLCNNKNVHLLEPIIFKTTYLLISSFLVNVIMESNSLFNSNSVVEVRYPPFTIGYLLFSLCFFIPSSLIIYCIICFT